MMSRVAAEMIPSRSAAWSVRALHLTRVDVRLGLLYSIGELGGLLSAAAVPVLIKRLAIGRLAVAFLAASAVGLAFLAVARYLDLDRTQCGTGAVITAPM